MCGGPDWPTSVLCGMLGLSYVSTSLGLVPIVAFTLPTTLAGAFKTKTRASGLGGMDSLAMTILLIMQVLPTSYFPLPTSHFPLPTSHFLLPTSYFLLPYSVPMTRGRRSVSMISSRSSSSLHPPARRL